ncbi:SsgA family sporulation/cell division regulator [Streptomyces sp. NPDC057284]|uniref:SsgA family sporulation/cell division regulator n=1 Tax=Streptomyces sp. NPDC057284 TaxID=3346083 RepID=UPI00364157C3
MTMQDSSAATHVSRRVLTWQACVHQVRRSLRFPIAATFRYSAADPLAVQIVFRPPNAPQVAWHVSRDVLISGTRVLTGVGDVRLWPVWGSGREGQVHLRLGHPQAHALFTIDRSALIRWLSHTCSLVPPGTEAELLDWDALTRLLPDA